MNTNVENIKYAIEVMKGADNLCMINFQSGAYTHNEDYCTTIEQLHRCGSTACFLGYLALTPLWREFFTNAYGEGVELRYDGSFLSFNDYKYPDNSLAEFFGIPLELASSLIFNYNYHVGCPFYPTEFHEVLPEHVIDKLNQILSGELL